MMPRERVQWSQEHREETAEFERYAGMAVAAVGVMLVVVFRDASGFGLWLGAGSGAGMIGGGIYAAMPSTRPPISWVLHRIPMLRKRGPELVDDSADTLKPPRED